MAADGTPRTGVVDDQWLFETVGAFTYMQIRRRRWHLDRTALEEVQHAALEHVVCSTVPAWQASPGTGTARLVLMIGRVVGWMIAGHFRRGDIDSRAQFEDAPIFTRSPSTPLDILLAAERERQACAALDALSQEEAGALESRVMGERIDDYAARIGRDPSQVSRRFRSAMAKIDAARRSGRKFSGARAVIQREATA